MGLPTVVVTTRMFAGLAGWAPMTPSLQPVVLEVAGCRRGCRIVVPVAAGLADY